MSCVLDTNRGTIQYRSTTAYMSHTHSIVSHRHTTQNSIDCNICVNTVCDHPSIFHGFFDGQGKLFEAAEENQVVPEIVWARFVSPVLWFSSARRAQVAAEEELWPCCPTVFQVNSMAILLNAVRVLGNNQHSILHKSSTTASFMVCT